MSKRPCRHGLMRDFKVDGQWRCSHCGVLGAWGDSWSYYGQIGCRKCHSEPAIEFVACSETCRARCEAARAQAPKAAEIDYRQEKRARVQSEIERVAARLARLKAEDAKLANETAP